MLDRVLSSVRARVDGRRKEVAQESEKKKCCGKESVDLPALAMSSTSNMVAVVDVHVQFTRFRNIDLYHQGVYYLRSQVYIPGRGAQLNPSRGSLDKKKNKKKRDIRKAALDAGKTIAEVEPIHDVDPLQVAVPHHFYSRPSKLTASARGVHVVGSDDHGRPAMICEEDRVFHSRAILVRYVEEIQEFNEGCSFQLEVGFSPIDYRTFKPTLLVDLMWCDVEEDARGSIQGLKGRGEFRRVARSEFQLHSILRHDGTGSLHHYVPLLFDDIHFCQTGLLVHSVLRELKVLPEQYERALADDSKRLLAAQGGGTDTTPPRPQADLGRLFASFLFPVPPSLDSIEDVTEFYKTEGDGNNLRADAWFKRYITPLVQSHNDLATFLRRTNEHCLTQSVHQSQPENGSVELLDEWGMAVGSTTPALEPDVTSALASFSSRLGSLSPSAISKGLLQSINEVASRIAVLWDQLLEVLPLVYERMELMLRAEWEAAAKTYFETAIISQSLERKHLVDPPDLDSADTHAFAAAELRKDSEFAPKPGTLAEKALHDLMPVFDVGMFSRREVGCVFFKSHYDAGRGSISEYDKFMQEESEAQGKGASAGLGVDSIILESNPPSASKNTLNGLHVVVLQHGFQGSQFDMRLFRDFLTFLYPSHKYLIATSNQNDTDVNFDVMGHRLATEIVSFLNDHCGNGGEGLARLSFVGHSIGGVIIRTALHHKAMAPYLSKLHSFVTLSSPHVGHIFSPNYVNTGLWLMKRWKKSLALEEISLTDAREYENSFMYRLAQAGGLQLFQKKVLLVSSHTDTYAPYHSARLEMCSAAVNDTGQAGHAYRAMLEHLWKGVTAQRVVKVDISFKFEETGLDTLIGRAAHIRFLDSFELTAGLVFIWRELWDDD